ncbi:hypothetical protein ACGGZK_06730 [Agromyces sp. MMS24-K17]|uniref:hypothetical protein n=1 Tax=Agromyces sp. MMS24-K17 TaxID=3372850 RepID=UPI003754AB8E
MAGFRVGRRRAAEELEAHGADSATRVGSALVALDERLRRDAEELAFAEAELGPDAIAPATQALIAARGMLGEAFRLNRANHGPTPGASADVATRTARILELCAQADAVLDEVAAALADGVARTRRAPEELVGVRVAIERLRPRVFRARTVIDRLSARYARTALAPVEANPAHAEQLLGFAEHGVAVAERRRDEGHREQGNLALEASVDAVRRAAALLEAVEAFEVEAIRAESQLAAVVEESRRHLAVALAEPGPRPFVNAIADLQAALDALPPVGVITDPFAHLDRLRDANAALDASIVAAHATARDQTPDAVPPRLHLHEAIIRADRQLDVARDLIAGHAGRIGPEALTRLAESERIRVELGHSLGSGAIGGSTTIAAIDDGSRARAIEMADRVVLLATEALRRAREDLAAVRRGAPVV